jgi:zinc and cadmium transporter
VGFVRLFLAALAVAAAAFGSQAQDSPAPASSKTAAPPVAPRDLEERRDRAPAGSDTSIEKPPSVAAEVRMPAASAKSRVLLGFYCAMTVGASLFGGWLPRRLVLSHTRMQTVISLVAGLMLSIGIFHLLPHAVLELGEEEPDRAATGLMLGLVGMFLILRLFAFHKHSPAEPLATKGAAEHRLGHSEKITRDDMTRDEMAREEITRHGEASHALGHCEAHGGHSLSWVGICLGMSLHTLIDGLALGASVESDALQQVVGLWGLGTFLAVLLHKPIDSMSITSLMAVTGWSTRSQSLANVAFSLICPLGAVLFVLGLREFSGNQSVIVGWALAASAGVFLCIALCDLLPEMEFHSHNRVRLTAALMAGIAFGWAIHFLDPAHEHSHGRNESHASRIASPINLRAATCRRSGRAAQFRRASCQLVPDRQAPSIGNSRCFGGNRAGGQLRRPAAAIGI